MSWWTDIRDTVESVAVVAGNYFVPGSSIISSNIASKGSQEQLDSTLGQIAQVASAGVGLGIGSGTTGLPPSAIGSAIADTAVNAASKAVEWASGGSVTSDTAAAGEVIKNTGVIVGGVAGFAGSPQPQVATFAPVPGTNFYVASTPADAKVSQAQIAQVHAEQAAQQVRQKPIQNAELTPLLLGAGALIVLSKL